MGTIVVYDVETTGLAPQVDRIVQICIGCRVNLYRVNLYRVVLYRIVVSHRGAVSRSYWYHKVLSWYHGVISWFHGVM